MKKINYKLWKKVADKIANHIKTHDGLDEIYGVPRGGSILAVYLANKLNLKIVEKPNEFTIVVDDLIDSGKTMSKYANSNCACFYAMFSKSNFKIKKFDKKYPSNFIIFGEKNINDWIEFWYEDTKKDNNDLIIRMIEFIGDNPTREGLLKTPRRVIKSWLELYSGYQENIDEKITVFDCEDYNEMVILKDIEFYSTCEHHLLPFFGRGHIAYIPNKKIVGISKLARILDHFARRLQNQERITQNVTDYIMNKLKPKGVMVLLEAQHFCMKARGVSKQNSIMTTSSIRGVFNEEKVRNEFLSIIKK